MGKPTRTSDRSVRAWLCALSVAVISSSCGGGGESASQVPGPGGGGQPPPSVGSGVIAGRVTGAVVSGVTVQIVGPSTSTVVTQTNGEYRVEGLAAGAYTVIPVRSSAAHFYPASATVTSDGADETVGIDFNSYVPPQVAGFAPTDIGDELWAWGWAGDTGQNLTLRDSGPGPTIQFMLDLSGRGNHFANTGERSAAYLPSLTLASSSNYAAWSTSLPLIGSDRWADGSDQFGSVYYQSNGMGAASDFYLALAMVNTRGHGNRELWGSDPDHGVVFDQGEGDLYLNIGGVRRKVADGTLPDGPMVLELWRETNGRIRVMANGVPSGLDVTFAGTFDVAGFGWDGAGTSYFDDYLLEILYCDALPPEIERDQIREYLHLKWNLW